MRLRVRPMGLQDVQNCVSLLASHPEERRRYGPLLEQLPAAWGRLIRNESLNSAMVEEMDAASPRLVALGVSVFISDSFLWSLRTAPLVWIGPELTRRATGRDFGILSTNQIREANSDDGVNLAIWTGALSARQDDERIHVELWRACLESHVGYQIRELVCQPLDLRQIHRSMHGGLSWLSGEGNYIDGRSQPWERLLECPFILGGSRETAKSTFGSWFSWLFSYTPPRIYFRPAEQRLLLAPLRGLTDGELSDELGISRSAVKKTWLMVYNRAAAALPGEWPERAVDDGETKRGKGKKQHLVAYLRSHMEELRPVLPPRSGHGVTRAAAPMHGANMIKAAPSRSRLRYVTERVASFHER